MINFVIHNLEQISYIIAIAIIISPLILKKYFEKEHIAGLTITIGILGTFVGVCMGLLGFDTNNITESIPKLIDGLQTAFVTSIAGLFTNIILRTVPFLYGFKKSPEGQSDDLAREMIESINKMTKAISGEGDSSMVTQLQKIRTTNIDGFDKMNKSFDEFADKMIADNTQSLIDALTEVMKDFNTKINEQFGENFKKLNEGVGAMLDWQKEYKSQVEILTTSFKQIHENLEGVDKNLENSAASQSSIIESNLILKKLLQDFSIQVDSFAHLGEKAKESFPIIEKNMNNLTSAANNYIENSLQQVQNDYDRFARTQTEISKGYQNTIEKMIKDNADRVQKLDVELGQELNKALESLGSQLTSLSQHFVNDYKPLTEQLRNVLQIAQQVK